MASYAYDYLGRRVSKTVYGSPNVVTKYVYDGDQILAEYDGSGTLVRKFIYGPGIDEPICLIEVADNNAVYYYHFDGLGSVVALSDVNRVLVERYTYDVFGRPTIRDPNGSERPTSALGNPYLFTGRAWDAETALYYYRARYYDYSTGRFLQPDPIGYTDSLNVYAYVGNNPVSMLDPSGLYRSVDLGFKNGKLTMTITVPITYIPAGVTSEQMRDAVAKFDAGIERAWEAYQGPIAIDMVVTHPTEAGQPTNPVYIRPGTASPMGEVKGNYTVPPFWIESTIGIWSYKLAGERAAHEVGHFMGFSDRYFPELPYADAWPFFENNIMSCNPAGVVEHKTVIELLIQELFYRLGLASQKAQVKK